MKKMILALALVLTVGMGLGAVEAFARCGGYGGGGYHQQGPGNCGYGMYGAAAQNNPEFQKFLDATKDLRASLAADRGEFRALMAGQNPDPARARALSEGMFTKRTQLADKAREMNVTLGCDNGNAGCRFATGCPGAGKGLRQGAN